MVFRPVTPDFSVSEQMSREDFARAAALGFRTVVCNRPDGEQPGQISEAEAREAANAAGLQFHALPFAGPPPPAVVGETAELLDVVPSPVLAYCRSGTRSITVWAFAQALAGKMSPPEILSAAAKAGYNLSGASVALEHLAPRG
jgi:sulfide:quinone oxidoreductase